jgi:hypothetical protein
VKALAATMYRNKSCFLLTDYSAFHLQHQLSFGNLNLKTEYLIHIDNTIRLRWLASETLSLLSQNLQFGLLKARASTCSELATCSRLHAPAMNYFFTL